MNHFSDIQKPKPIIGVGLRHPHYEQALNAQSFDNSEQYPTNASGNAQLDFIEIHAENFFAQGGISQSLLNDVTEKYKVSVHGTSLGLGSAVKVPADVLNDFARVVKNSNAYLVSEHLCFNRVNVNGQTLHSGDLLPLAYNQQSLDILCSNIQEVQERLKRPILIENLSAYISPSDLDPISADSMDEIDFLTLMAEQSGCGLLLDLNNLIVNAINQQVHNPVSHIFEMIKRIPATIIGEIHLAGFSDQSTHGFIVDDHANAVSAQCWELYSLFTQLIGNKPTLVEWDNQLPSWHILLAEADKARAISQSKGRLKMPSES